jgi:hypothetical protein
MHINSHQCIHVHYVPARLLHTAACLQEEVEAADAALQQPQQQQPTATAAAAAGEQGSASPAPAPADPPAPAAERGSAAAVAGCQHELTRVAIWFHHIKSTQKRKDIVAWARELNIGATMDVERCFQGF